MVQDKVPNRFSGSFWALAAAAGWLSLAIYKMALTALVANGDTTLWPPPRPRKCRGLRVIVVAMAAMKFGYLALVLPETII